MALHPVVEQVTNRIIKRSRPSRQAYLAHLDAARVKREATRGASRRAGGRGGGTGGRPRGYSGPGPDPVDPS